jgi:hypothetical protein
MVADQQEWITLEQAYNHVIEEVILPERAERELSNKFITGEVATKAARIIVGFRDKQTIPVEGPLPSNTWRESQFKFLVNENAVEIGPPWRRNRAEAVTVSARQLYQFWPKKAASRSKKWSADEIRTAEWLRDDIARRGADVPKSERCKYAKDHFKITDRGFNRIWQDVVEKSGKKDELTKAGRKRKLNRRTK